MCYNCGGRGHMSRQYPSSFLFCGVKGFTRHSTKRRMVNQPFQCKGIVEGQLVNDMVLDISCFRTLVRSDLLGEKKFKGKTFTVQCMYSYTHLLGYRARGERESSNSEGSSVRYTTTVSIAKDRCSCFSELLKAERQEKALMVVTRSQSKRAEINRTEQAELEKIVEVTATPSQRETKSNGSLEPEGSNVVGQSDIWLTQYNFDEDMFVGNKNRKERKSRSEKGERLQACQTKIHGR